MSAYSLEEVSEHNSASSLWIIIEGGVYDVTDYINLHPGGAQALLRNGGKDASTMFRLLHGDDAWKQLETMRVGHLASDMKQSARENENETQDSLKSLSLDVDQSQRTDTKEGLLRTSVLSVKQDTEGRCCYLQIRNPDSIVFDDKTFPNFGHVLLHVDRNRNDTLVERSAISGFYSPSFICESFIEFVVKPAGEKSTRLCQLEVNAEVWISSTPLKPNVPSNQVPSTFLSIRPVHVTFIGAGSGVTPFLRLLRQIVTRNPIQIPTLTFIVCQSAPEAQVGISAIRSILEMQAVNPTEKTRAVQLKTYFHYSKAPNPCHRINMNDLLQYGVYTSTQVFICGPEAFNKSLHAMFVQLGFQGKSVQIIQ